MSDEVASRLVDETNISPELVAVREARGREGPGRADLVLRLRRYSGRQDQQGGGRQYQAGRRPEEPRATAGERRRTPAGPAGRGERPRPRRQGASSPNAGRRKTPETWRPAPPAAAPGHADAAGAPAAERSVSLRRRVAREGGEVLGGEPRRGQNSRLSALGSRLSALGSLIYGADRLLCGADRLLCGADRLLCGADKIPQYRQ